MAKISDNSPARLPDHATVETVIASLPAGADEIALAEALSTAFPGFAFSTTSYDDQYWRDTRSVIGANGARIAEYRPWMEGELAKENGDIHALWTRLRLSDLQISEWHGNSVYAFAPTGPGAADYVQVTLGREVEWRAGPVVNPGYRPWARDELLDPSWVQHGHVSDDKVLTGPLYRLPKRGSSVVHIRTFLTRCQRFERGKREARRSEMESRVWVGPNGAQTPFFHERPDWFVVAPREIRFFQDWQESSAREQRVYEHWALDIQDCEYRGEREIGFITRPLRLPKEHLEAGKLSVHSLMDRIEAIDREVGLPFGWFFLMTHGNRVEPDVGEMIAKGLRADRVRLPDHDAKILLRWADRRYGF